MNKRCAFLTLFTLLQTVYVQAFSDPGDSTIALPGIDINGKRLFLQQTESSRQIRTTDNLSGIGGDLSEALKQLPSFSTDIEGNTLFRGSAQTTLLIHGIPYGLLEENRGDILIQLPSFYFNSIQLFPTPKTNYIPDGDGGILSFSTDSSTRSPLEIEIGGGSNNRYNAGLSLNFHPGKFRIGTKYNYRREYRERSFNKYTTTPEGSTRMNNNATGRPDIHTGNVSVSYALTSKDLISGYGLFHRMEYNRYGGIGNTKLNPDGEVINRMLRHRYNFQEQTGYGVESRWIHTFGLSKDMFRLTLNYNNFRYNEDNLYKNENPTNGQIIKQDNLFIDQKKHQYYISADYSKVLTSSLSLNGGYTGRIKQDRYSMVSGDLNENTWIPNPAKSTDFSFDRVIHMLYLSLEKDLTDFHIYAGIQAEHTLQTKKNTQNKFTARDNYFHIYPQLNLRYDLPHAGKLGLNYAQRVNRPSSAELNPFIDSSDPLFIKQGNPDLRPEYIHLIEASYTYANHFFRFVPSLYYRYRSNRMMNIALQSDNQQIWKKENWGNTQTAGFEIVTFWTIGKHLSSGISGTIFYDEIDGRNIGYGEKEGMVCWDIKGNVLFKLTSNTELQIDGYYLSDKLTAQGKIKGRYCINTGASQYFMHRKLRLNVSIQNIFDSLSESTISYILGMQINQKRNRDARIVWLMLSCHL